MAQQGSASGQQSGQRRGERGGDRAAERVTVKGAEREDHREGTVARSLERQTARLPSDLFLWAATASIGWSLYLQYTGERNKSLFVGQWAPTFLILGMYNKLVKVAGSDRVTGGCCE